MKVTVIFLFLFRMKKVFISVLIFVFLCAQTGVAFASGENKIMITEIGAFESTGFEWVEIYNRGESPVDITGYKFWEGGVNHSVEVKQGEAILGAKEFAVIVQDDVKFKQQYPNVTSTIWDSSWGSLNESGEEIGLKDAGGNFLEQFSYISAPDFSLERKDVLVDDYSASNWVQHASGSTPGATNSVAVVPPEVPVETPPEEIPPVEETTPTSTPPNDIPPVEPFIETPTSTEPIIVFINEFLPQPNDGEKEWIELINESAVAVDLHNWTLEDGSGKIATASTTVNSQGFAVIELPSSKLNNSGDWVILKNPAGEIVHQVQYGDSEEGATVVIPKKGNSLARSGTNFVETTSVTKGAANVITAPLVPAPIQTTSGSSGGSSTNTQTQTSVPTSVIPSGAVVVNEVFPNPEGSDLETEFIELYNTTSNAIDLTGYKIADGATSFSLTQKIEPFSFLTLYRKVTHISLNNSGEEVVKLLSGTTIIDEMEFESEFEGQSLNRTENNEKKWSSTITPNAKNIISAVSESSEIKNDEEKSTSTKKIVSNNVSSTNEKEIAQYLQITEIFPAPEKSNDEFIELYNLSSSTLDISGFQVDDEEGGSRPYTFPEDTEIGSHQFFAVKKTDSHLSLNNTEDSARLLSPNGEVLEEIRFDEVQKNYSFALDENGEWQWTDDVTPGSANSISGPSENSVKKAKEGVTLTSIEKLREFEKGDRVQVQGTVIVSPGILSTQYFYIAAGKGVQIYMSSKAFPPLSVGDEIVVIGELSESQEQLRIKLKEKGDIKKLGKKKVEGENVVISEIDESHEGLLVSVSGEITEKKTAYLYVDDGGGEIEVVIKKGTGVQTKKFKLGEEIAVTGIVIPSKTGFQILPRSVEDISILPATPSSTFFVTSTLSDASTPPTGTSKAVLATTGGIGSLLLGFLAKIHGGKVVNFAKKYGGAAIAAVRKKKDDDVA